MVLLKQNSKIIEKKKIVKQRHVIMNNPDDMIIHDNK